ncbi:hypothetical protein [Methylobrevis pamukkalensis]|uniref:Uncharacterized protein n=1 Tax=Methylobrevis pamukkalensis TaxID=1439726 RepID=A0A1E3GWL0_9HYPH|nr:hypothetical protein [Methylobrevis pamukkalensis]ODN68443.1 hypothetical protein A6302_04260 [Methylobrevis pamukkalensis]
MAERRGIVHIGMPRTGTTTFQRLLHDQRAGLERRGLLYPDLTPPGDARIHLNHQPLGEVLDGRRGVADRAAMLARLEADLAATSAEIVILSYEGFCHAAGAAAVLADLLRRHGFRPETAVTVKPQAEYLNSRYTKQMQFLQETRDFRGFFRRAFRDRKLDYARLVLPFADTLGGPLHLVPLRDHRSQAPLIERLLAELDLADRIGDLVLKAGGDLVENPSAGPLAIEAERRLAILGAGHGLGEGAREATRLLEDEVARRGLDRGSFAGVDAEMQAIVADHWRASCEALARRAWGCAWEDRVAPAAPRPVNEIARLGADRETEALLAELVAWTSDQVGFAPRGPLRRRIDAVEAAAGAGLRRMLRRARARRG